MNEFLEAMAKLISERVPNVVWIDSPPLQIYRIRFEIRDVKYAIYEDYMYCWDTYNRGVSSIKYFNIADPKFDPEIIIDWIKSNG